MQQSLEEIEGKAWGEPPADASRLVATVYALRRRPVGALGVEGLRVLIGQKEGLEILLPLALDELERDPLAEGDFYPGDLLAAVVRVPHAYWQGHADQAARLRAVIDVAELEELDEELRGDIAAFRK
ncbi:contact-dependent growth inhibition system immunity protein [Actinoplanes sp. NPDC048796]|uniref:contact-dependent growth inhibition system immunity protein n=1 Tax=unclassified Actinoplanes TaxID=2626549 RepID=UPI0033C6C79A